MSFRYNDDAKKCDDEGRSDLVLRLRGGGDNKPAAAKKLSKPKKKVAEADQPKITKSRTRTKSGVSVEGEEKQVEDGCDESVIEEEVIEEVNSGDVDESEIDNQVALLVADCPCRKSNPQTTAKVDCIKCRQIWHAECLGMGGVTEKMVRTWVDWVCPFCFVESWPEVAGARPGKEPSSSSEVVQETKELDRPVTLRELQEELVAFRGKMKVDKLAENTASSRGLDSKTCGTLKTMVKDELHAINPVLRVTVNEAVHLAVKAAVESNVKNQFVEQKKTFADMAKGLNDTIVKKSGMDKDMLTEVFRTENGEMLEKTEQNLNREQWEREVRKKNVVIRKLPECNSEDPKARYTHDMNWLTEEAGVDKDDIVKCYRPGRRSEKRIRPLICVLKTEELVQKYTNYGKGCKISNGDEDQDESAKEAMFINVDLSPADQLADFRARQVRKANRRRTTDGENQYN